MSEQRKHKREDVEFVLKFKPKETGESFKYAYYENISLGGVKVVDLGHYVERGTLIQIELSLPYTPNSALANPLLIEGKTAHCEQDKTTGKYNFGVQFLEMPKEKTDKLKLFLQYANGNTALNEED